MKSRGKSVIGGWWNLGLPSVFLLCLFFFLLGLFASALFSQQDVPNVKPRVLVSVDLEKDFDPLPNGETGEHSLTSIPFQFSFLTRANIMARRCTKLPLCAGSGKALDHKVYCTQPCPVFLQEAVYTDRTVTSCSHGNNFTS